jgi:hypothetical protein
VLNCLHQPNELALIGCQFGVARGHLAIEESDRPAALVQHRPGVGARRVALHHEVMIEIR